MTRSGNWNELGARVPLLRNGELDQKTTFASFSLLAIIDLEMMLNIQERLIDSCWSGGDRVPVL
jgi:hypothetical protein